MAENTEGWDTDFQSIQLPTLGEIVRLENWGDGYLLADTNLGETFLVDFLSRTSRRINRANLAPAVRGEDNAG